MEEQKKEPEQQEKPQATEPIAPAVPAAPAAAAPAAPATSSPSARPAQRPGGYSPRPGGYSPRPGGGSRFGGSRPGGSRPGGQFKAGSKPRRKMDFKKKMRRKRCRFCIETIDIDFKDANLLRSFISERGKILSGHITGVCTKHQRRVGQAIKRARQIALIPYINV